MDNRGLTIVMAAILIFAFTSVAFALGDGNARKGKFLYRKHCRACHGETASDLSPASLTQAEWTTMFEDVTALPCHADWPEVSDEDLNDIFSYLHDFAKDSPSPATCS